MSKDSFLSLQNWPGQRIIFGAGAAGRATAEVLKARDIPVECFCDNNIAKSGERIGDLTVVHVGQLTTKTVNNPIFIIAVADIADVVSQLKVLGMNNWVAAGNLLLDYASGDDFTVYAVETCINCHQNYEHPEKVFMRSIDLVITEKCSLKCKDCSNLMQYYTEPTNYGSDDLLSTIDRFMAVVDDVNEFRVIGGEPFMNKQIDQVISHLNKQTRLQRVVIYTNGTIVPNAAALEAMRNEKVFVYITDYGDLSKNIAKLEAALKEHKVAYAAQEAQNWTACSEIKNYGRSEAELVDVFTRCCCKNLYTILDGKLYRCPFSAHIDRLHATPDYPDDYLNLATATSAETHEFVYGKTYLDHCNYCAGRFLDDPKIQPGIQTPKILEYSVVR